MRQIIALCDGDAGDPVEPDPIPKHTRQLVKALRAAQTAELGQLAQLLLEQEKDPHLARARLQSLRQFLDEAEACLV